MFPVNCWDKHGPRPGTHGPRALGERPIELPVGVAGEWFAGQRHRRSPRHLDVVALLVSATTEMDGVQQASQRAYRERDKDVRTTVAGVGVGRELYASTDVWPVSHADLQHSAAAVREHTPVGNDPNLASRPAETGDQDTYDVASSAEPLPRRRRPTGVSADSRVHRIDHHRVLVIHQQVDEVASATGDHVSRVDGSKWDAQPAREVVAGSQRDDTHRRSIDLSGGVKDVDHGVQAAIAADLCEHRCEMLGPVGRGYLDVESALEHAHGVVEVSGVATACLGIRDQQ